MRKKKNNMKAIYSNFDGLDVSFQCALPEKILSELCRAKKQAEEENSDVPIRLGTRGRIVSVGKTGSRGGFTYRFDTGLDGETWFVSDKLNRDKWHVRVSAKSLALASYGYDGVKKRMLDSLVNEFGARGVSSVPFSADGIEFTLSPKSYDWPLERVSRIDYCIDFKTDEFIPNPKAFVGKGRFKKHIINPESKGASHNEIVYSGQNIQYIRIGSLPNRQVVLYDKISDITAKRKSEWWNIWSIKKSEFSGQIWRVEARAGKKELNQWNLRRFSDFEKMAGNVISGILSNLKYTIPSDTDQNISRWPLATFWQDTIGISEKALQHHMSDAQRKMILEGKRQDIQNQFEKMMYGQGLSYAALTGRDINDMSEVWHVLGDGLMAQITQNPSKIAQKYQKARDKYQGLTGENP